MSDLYVNLNGPIDCRLLCKKIGRFVDNYNKKFGLSRDRILVLSIKDITHTTTNENIQKLEKK